VVNYDVPHTPEDYVHRIGRTGRVEAVGDAFTLMSPEEQKDVVAIERFLGRSIPRVLLPDFDYKAKPRPDAGNGRGASRGGRAGSGGGGGGGGGSRSGHRTQGESRGGRGGRSQSGGGGGRGGRGGREAHGGSGQGHAGQGGSGGASGPSFGRRPKPMTNRRRGRL
jgi:ATP-dependent RNA helicase RhlE